MDRRPWIPESHGQRLSYDGLMRRRKGLLQSKTDVDDQASESAQIVRAQFHAKVPSASLRAADTPPDRAPAVASKMKVGSSAPQMPREDRRRNTALRLNCK